jgi:hypothetical protein
MWNFSRARVDAIDALDRLVAAPERRIQLAREFDIPSWLVPALMDLIRREKALGPEEVALLGINWVLKIASMREKYGHNVAELHAEFTHQMMMRGDRQMQYHRSSTPFDAVVPEPPMDQRRQMRQPPKLTQAIVEAEFDLAGGRRDD